MTKPVINIADVVPEPRPAAFAPSGPAAERFDAKMGFIAPRIGAQKLGYNITVVPPGKRGFPFHNHRVNEEMFFILQGSGEVRIGETTYPIRTGDVIACPPGRGGIRAPDHQYRHGGSALSGSEYQDVAGDLRIPGYRAVWPSCGIPGWGGWHAEKDHACRA
jgi:Cupin domain